MANPTTETYDSTVSQSSRNTSGLLFVPVDVQREQNVSIDDTLSVTLSDLGHEFIDTVSFENQQVAGDFVTVPAHIMREVDIEGGQSVVASFEKVKDSDDESSELAESPGAITPETSDDDDRTVDEIIKSIEEEDGVDNVVDISDNTGEDQSDDEEESEKGLGELFG